MCAEKNLNGWIHNFRDFKNIVHETGIAADFSSMKGKNILLVDDVYGGGGTTKALTALVEKAGATISGHAVCAVEEGGNYPEGLVYLYTLPVL